MFKESIGFKIKNATVRGINLYGSILFHFISDMNKDFHGRFHIVMNKIPVTLFFDIRMLPLKSTMIYKTKLHRIIKIIILIDYQLGRENIEKTIINQS